MQSQLLGNANQQTRLVWKKASNSITRKFHNDFELLIKKTRTKNEQPKPVTEKPSSSTQKPLKTLGNVANTRYNMLVQNILQRNPDKKVEDITKEELFDEHVRQIRKDHVKMVDQVYGQKYDDFLKFDPVQEFAKLYYEQFEKLRKQRLEKTNFEEEIAQVVYGQSSEDAKNPKKRVKVSPEEVEEYKKWEEEYLEAIRTDKLNVEMEPEEYKEMMKKKNGQDEVRKRILDMYGHDGFDHVEFFHEPDENGKYKFVVHRHWKYKQRRFEREQDSSKEWKKILETNKEKRRLKLLAEQKSKEETRKVAMIEEQAKNKTKQQKEANTASLDELKKKQIEQLENLKKKQAAEAEELKRRQNEEAELLKRKLEEEQQQHEQVKFKKTNVLENTSVSQARKLQPAKVNQKTAEKIASNMNPLYFEDEVSKMTPKQKEEFNAVKLNFYQEMLNDPEEAKRLFQSLGIKKSMIQKFENFAKEHKGRTLRMEEVYVPVEDEDIEGAGSSMPLSSEEETLLKNEREIIDMDNNKIDIVEEYDTYFDRYKRYATQEERKKDLLMHWGKMVIPELVLPPELATRIKQIVQKYPKKVVQDTANILSATFRLRTGGFGNRYLFDDKNKDEGEKTAYVEKKFKDKETQQLYEEQLKVLSELKNYSKNASKINERNLTKLKKVEQPQIIYGEVESVAYIAHRLPAVYATSYRIFDELKKRLPHFVPKTVLDFGTGPGTSIWAAKQVWIDDQESETQKQEALKEVMAIEPSTAMMNVANDLMTGDESMEEFKRRITWRRFLNEHMRRKYDLVIASFVLNEIVSDAERDRIVKALWKVTDGVLVFIEPGTPLGYQLILKARDNLIHMRETNGNEGEEAPVIVAPCPNMSVCPMKNENRSWCHFTQRIQREAFQDYAKKGLTKSYEDEKYSYIAVRREKVTLNSSPKVHQQAAKELATTLVNDYVDAKAKDKEKVTPEDKKLRREYHLNIMKLADETHSWSRLVNRPIKKGGHTYLNLCTHQGTLLVKTVVTKSDEQRGGGYRFARKAFWGDLFPLDFLLKQKALQERIKKLEEKSK